MALESEEPMALASEEKLLFAYELVAGGQSVRCLGVLPDGSIAGGAQDNMVHMWSPHGAVRIRVMVRVGVRLGQGEGLGVNSKLAGHERIMGVDGIPAMAVTDQWLASGGKDGHVILRDLTDLTVIVDQFGGHGAENSTTNSRVISCLCVHRNCLVSGSWDHNARVWRPTGAALPAPPFELAYELKAHSQAVLSCASVGDLLATGSGDSDIRLWKDAECVGTLKGHKFPVRAMAVTGNGALVSGDNDGTLCLWDPGTGQLTKSVKGHDEHCFALAWVGDKLYSGGPGQVLKLWDGELNCLGSIYHPTGDIHAIVGLMNGDIAVAADQGVLVHTSDPNRAADPHTLAQWHERAMALQVATESGQLAADSGTVGQPGKKDFCFPVEMPGQPGKMNLEWNRNEDPEIVAARFLADNQLPASHMPDVLQFLGRVMGQAAAAPGPAAPVSQLPEGPCDFEFPVQLEQGFAPKIRWNRGEEPEEVADRFLRANNLPWDNKPDIIAFIQQVAGTAPAPAPSAAATPSPEAQATMIKNITDMGFDEASARRALEATGWVSVEGALGMLLG
eukprot:TRINITY_DN24842_c0_g1_i6.p1 TRINITY_DN24842_c0_g1~~TRINITY_DN24842_c0_g1_i6.p1  ORF type:complete len:562 (+),score=114.92 TRINITY_DN24842_c0_g1_i6:191-1876(+)